MRAGSLKRWPMQADGPRPTATHARLKHSSGDALSALAALLTFEAAPSKADVCECAPQPLIASTFTREEPKFCKQKTSNGRLIMMYDL